MINLDKRWDFKCIIIVFSFILLFASEPSFSQIPNNPVTGVNGEFVKTYLKCDHFPGFINKIVKCITHITSREVIAKNLESLHAVMVYVSNGAVMLFIMFFSLKMMFLGTRNVKSELFMVVLTAFLVMWFNSTTNLMKVMDLFVKTQAEFANAVTTSIATSSRYNPDTDDDGNPDALCFGPLDDQGNYQFTVNYTIWQRVDCIIGYILGAHPVVEYFGQQLNEDETNTPHDSAARRAATKAKFAYEWVEGTHGFKDMATDPYKFFKEDAKAEGHYEIFVSFSMIVIAVSMMFNDSVGIIVILTGLFLVFLMIAAFGQAAFVYITSLFAIIILMLFAPLMLPCVLFKTTKQIFQFWLQGLMAYTLVPGILLAYLSFMIFVIQFVLNYKGSNDDSFTLVEAHFGKPFMDADKRSKPVVSYTVDNEDVIHVSYNRSDMNTNISKVYGDVEDKDRYSEVGGGIGDKDTDSKNAFRSAIEGKNISDLNQAGFGGSVSGALQNMINVPGFTFGGFDYKDLVVNPYSTPPETLSARYPNADLNPDEVRSVREFVARNIHILSADPTLGPLAASELDGIYTKYENDKEKMTMLQDLVTALSSADYRNKVNYMHLLLVVFLILSVTLAFMQNVLTFGHEMAGAATTAQGKAVNLYNKAYGRMYKSVNA